jgi:hypothetical protein
MRFLEDLSKVRYDDGWVRYGDANSLEILYVRSNEIWDPGIHQNNKKHREPAPSMAHQV